MIDKRAKLKIMRLKEEEDETKLSKKTSFSSFYNLEEEMAGNTMSQPKLKEPVKPKRPKHSLSGMLCARPQTATSFVPRSNSVLNKKLLRKVRKPTRVANMILPGGMLMEEEVTHNIRIGQGTSSVSRAFSQQRDSSKRSMKNSKNMSRANSPFDQVASSATNARAAYQIYKVKAKDCACEKRFSGGKGVLGRPPLVSTIKSRQAIQTSQTSLN